MALALQWPCFTDSSDTPNYQLMANKSEKSMPAFSYKDLLVNETYHQGWWRLWIHRRLLSQATQWHLSNSWLVDVHLSLCATNTITHSFSSQISTGSKCKKRCLHFWYNYNSSFGLYHSYSRVAGSSNIWVQTSIQTDHECTMFVAGNCTFGDTGWHQRTLLTQRWWASCWRLLV